MTSRANPYASLDLVKPLIDYSTTIQGRLEPSLAHLVKIRASQINGCAMCPDIAHTGEPAKDGETQSERLYLLDAWRESPLYTDRERAALEPDEALVRLPATPRAGRRTMRRSEASVHRSGAGEPHPADRRDHELQPARRRLPHPPPDIGGGEGGLAPRSPLRTDHFRGCGSNFVAMLLYDVWDLGGR